MATNRVEATLVCRFVDGVTPHLGRVEAAVRRNFAVMGSLAANVAAAFGGATSAIAGWAQSLYRRSLESQSHFGKIGWAVAAMGAVVAGAFYKIAQAAGNSLAEIRRGTSEVLELRLAYEGLTAAMGVPAGQMMRSLQRATDGLVSSTVLLRNHRWRWTE